MLSILHTYNWYVNTNGVNINDEDELIENLLGEEEVEEQNEFDEEESILDEWMSDEESILSDDEFRSIVCRLFD